MQLLTCAIKSLYEYGITVRSVTTDEAQSNIANVRHLGCITNYS